MKKKRNISLEASRWQTSSIKIHKVILTLTLILYLSGCATQAKNVSPKYFSPIKYQNYSCDEMRQEMERTSITAKKISGQQNATAAKDAVAMTVGLVVFWPTLFLLVGGDKEEELGLLKGKFDALEITANQKQCGELLAQIAEERSLQKAQKIKDPFEEKTTSD